LRPSVVRLAFGGALLVALIHPARAVMAEGPASTAASPDAGLDDVVSPHLEVDGDETNQDALPPKPEDSQASKPGSASSEGMVRIAGARFTMGTDDRKAPPNERPARIVTVQSFWIDKTEVTVGAYRACVERGACSRPARGSASCTYDMNEPNLPVSCVPWTSAQVYCLAMNKRLPREAEWEYAARGKTSAKYPWGGASAVGCGGAVTMASESTHKSCGGRQPSRVGTHPSGASPFGVLDMSGNVEEWVEDWYVESAGDRSPRAGASHVLRGGGWLSLPSQATSTSRNWGSAREMGPNVGFRCARDDVEAR
jgi:formylglycine-generating enzyme required for sulfatase activity